MPSKAEILGQNTMQAKLGLWAANLRDNLNLINLCEDITSLPKIKGPALCLAAGSSLELHYDEIPMFKGTVLSCERNLIPLLEKGIIPDYVISIDGSEVMTGFIDSPLVDEHIDEMIGIFSTTVSPKILERWRGDKIFFNAWLDDINEIKSVSLVFQEITRKATCHTGGHCGSTLWYLSYYLKANPIILMGIDMAYPASIPDLSHTSIWEGIKHLHREEILEYYQREKNPFGNEVITDYVWDGFKDAWMSWIREMQESETIQCSDYTILHDPPLKVMPFKEYLQKL
ncbi:MAG: DUF115 domain-containing protein [Methanolobus sp.]|uniref:6-hydroxymethylpterin diphosphokinase MptE-like protein n=1 Tax=Methanolobus sp. TaxID=1874737 RepID=UPI0027321C38|nr:6-hydroxymethylpterin diphosphokinase MptE-like protein [Methanolobus sp.]MDP2217201.1 DUF115 domain-containing protein [Methanolobus sp.]